jgi:hypothetical protein
MRMFYTFLEMEDYRNIHSWTMYIPLTVWKAVKAIMFFAGFALLPPLIMTRRALMDRRIRLLVLALPVLTAGMAIEIFMIPHYLAPFTAVFYAIGLQSMRHLRVWKPEGKPVGMTLVRFCVSICVVMAVLRVFSGPLGLKVREWPTVGWVSSWSGPEHFGEPRARVESQLEALPGRQLILVRYASDHNSMDEWVYNLADIDGSKVVWAREMDAANNLELMHYYRDRKVWLVEPDAQPTVVVPYPGAEQPAAAEN